MTTWRRRAGSSFTASFSETASAPGFAGAGAATLAASGETAMNPAMLGAFALATIAGSGPFSFPGLDRKPELAQARSDVEAIGRSYQTLSRLAPRAGETVPG